MFAAAQLADLEAMLLAHDVLVTSLMWSCIPAICEAIAASLGSSMTEQAEGASSQARVVHRGVFSRS